MAVDGSDTSLAKTCPMLTHKRLATDDADILLRYHTSLSLAEWLCRTVDRIDPARVLGPRYCFGRGTSASDSAILCRLLQLRQNASVFAQGYADFSSDSSDRNHSFTPDPRRASPSLRPTLSFRYTQAVRLRISDKDLGSGPEAAAGAAYRT
jgi:uncharacterized lipoprotein